MRREVPQYQLREEEKPIENIEGYPNLKRQHDPNHITGLDNEEIKNPSSSQ